MVSSPIIAKSLPIPVYNPIHNLKIRNSMKPVNGTHTNVPQAMSEIALNGNQLFFLIVCLDIFFTISRQIEEAIFLFNVRDNHKKDDEIFRERKRKTCSMRWKEFDRPVSKSTHRTRLLLWGMLLARIATFIIKQSTRPGMRGSRTEARGKNTSVATQALEHKFSGIHHAYFFH